MLLQLLFVLLAHRRDEFAKLARRHVMMVDVIDHHDRAKGATTEGIIEVMTKEFGARLAEGADAFTVDEAVAEGNAGKAFDYSQAKTLVMFCNGMWCGQSPNNILNLLKFGYPADKIKWYRGGMQDWEVLGLSTVKP
jgi:rhodanese-related sulfurtransferase